MKIGLITLSITPDMTTRLTEALEAQTRRADFAVLVANSPRVRERAMKQRLWDHVLYPGYNVSFSHGNNLASREMPDDVTRLLLLNDDVIPSPTFIERLAEAYGAAAEHGDPPAIIGSLFLHADGTVNHAGGCEVDPARAWGEHIGRHESAEKFSGVATVPWVTFAGALISRGLWDYLGGLDEGFVYGYEDHDFCLRAIEDGAQIVCARDAIALHEECGTRSRGGTPRDQQNAQLFASRWAGDPLRAALADYRERFPQAEGIPA